MKIVISWGVHTCIKCKGLYAFPESVNNRYRENHATFWCPYCGDPHYFPQLTDEERLKIQKQELEQHVRWCENKIEEKEFKFKQADGRARAYKGLYRKVKEAPDEQAK